MTTRVLGVAIHLMLDPYLLLIPLTLLLSLQRSSVLWAGGFQSTHADSPMPSRNSVATLAGYLAEFTKGGPLMHWISEVKRALRTIRWKMLIIFAFFCVLSTLLIAALSIAVLNIVIRRESAYLVEERLAAMTDNQRFITNIAGRGGLCPDPARGASVVQTYSDLAWSGTRTTVVTQHGRLITRPQPAWLASPFSAIVRDHEYLAIRSYREVEKGSCVYAVLADTPLDPNAVAQVSRAAALQITDNHPMRLSPLSRTGGHRWPDRRELHPCVQARRSCRGNSDELADGRSGRLGYLQSSSELHANC